MATSGALLLLLSLCAGAQALKMPSYLKPCSRNDPNLNECAKKSATEGIPHFINGDPKYRVPPLEPIIIDLLAVKKGTNNFGMEFVATNASMSGLKDVVVTDIRIDLKKNTIEYDLFFPLLNIISQYNVTGRVLLLPIVGEGLGEIKLKNVSATIKFDIDRQISPALKKEIVVPKNSALTFNVGRMTIHLNNLFNGDKFLGDNMNQFMNENWQELVREMGPAVGDALNQFIFALLKNIFQLVSYDDAFPDV